MIVFYSRLIDEKVIPPVDDFSRSMMVNGEVASILCWVSDAGNYCKAIEEGGGEPYVGGQLIEEGAKESGWYIKPSSLYAISKYSKHPQEAARLVDYLVNSPEMAALQLSEKGVPVSKSALNTIKNIEGGLDGYDSAAGEYMNAHREQMSVIRPIMENEDVISAFKSGTDDYRYNADTLESISQSVYYNLNSIFFS